MATTEQAQCPVHLEDTYNPFVAPQLDDPYPIWEQSRHEQPVFHSSVLDAWIVTRYEDVVSVLRNTEEFGPVAERKTLAESCPEAEALLAELPSLEETSPISAEPPIHTKLRRYLQPAFTPRRSQRLEPELRRIANTLVDNFEANGSGDFYADYAYKFPLSVVCHLVGLSDDHHDQLKIWAAGRGDLRYGNPSKEQQVELARGQHDSYQFSLDLVAQRRADPGDDFLSEMIADSDTSDDPMTEAQLASQATVLLTTGHETTSHFLTMFLRRMLQDPARWAALVADPSSASKFVDEGLRMDGAAQALWRTAKCDTEVAGVQIPAGALVSVVLSSANADENVFADPDVFDIERPNSTQHLAFGRGIHTCAGAGIAKLETTVTFEVLARRLPNLRLAADDGYWFKPNAIQRMAKRLYVEWN